MHTREMDLYKILLNWPIATPSTLTSLAGGTYNQVWLVEMKPGPAYILRLVAGLEDLPRIRYEAALLTLLHRASLPFHLPLPLLSYSGDMLMQVELEHEGQVIATLTPSLPGQVPDRTAANIARVGVALAQLDVALASIPESSLPIAPGSLRFHYGDLAHCHPLVPNPQAAVEQLALDEQVLDPQQARELVLIFQNTQRDWESFSAQDLPQQVLHRDCGPGNVLMESERVTAILDFEFAGFDRRLFDLCVAISWWPVRMMGTGQEWELIDSFGRAYNAYVPLTEAELFALPASLRMRDTTALTYRIGRYIAGLESAQTIQELARHSLWRETWLRANQEELLHHALTWNQ